MSVVVFACIATAAWAGVCGLAWRLCLAASRSMPKPATDAETAPAGLNTDALNHLHESFETLMARAYLRPVPQISRLVIPVPRSGDPGPQPVRELWP